MIKIPFPLKVCVLRYETHWQIDHNLAKLFSCFSFISIKWSSTVTKRKEMRKNWIFFFLYLTLPRKKERRHVLRKASTSHFTFSKLVHKWSLIILWGKMLRLNPFSFVTEEMDSKGQLLFLCLSMKQGRHHTEWQHNAAINNGPE